MGKGTSFFDKTGQTPPKYMIDRGSNVLAVANKRCRISDQKTRIVCVKKEINTIEGKK